MGDSTSGTAAVTGATGHIGANLVRLLLARTRPVRALVRKDLRALEGLDIERVEGDVLEYRSLVRLFTGAHTVFHLAARISIAGSERGMVDRVNLDGTRNVIKACGECGVRRLVHFSSIHALLTSDSVITESQRLATGSTGPAYDRSKAEGELAVRSAAGTGLETVVLNPTAVIGPYDFKPSRMGEVLAGLCRRRYSVLVDGGYNWVDVRDVALGAIAAEEKGRSGESYLLAGHWAHFRDLMSLVEKAAGRRGYGLYIPLQLAGLAAPFALAATRLLGRTPKFTPESIQVLRGHRHVSYEKAARDLGYSPRPLEETIRDTLAWFREAGITG